MFENFNFENFWCDCGFSKEDYQGEPVTEEMVKTTEAKLGYKLPVSYIWLMTQRNGGFTDKSCCPIYEDDPSRFSNIQIECILGMGNTRRSIFNTSFWNDEWGYPEIGIAICECPSAGHEMVFLDYSLCGPQGEPRVVYIEQEDDYDTLVLAENFEEFIKKLKTEEEIEELYAEIEAGKQKSAPSTEKSTKLTFWQKLFRKSPNA